MVPFEKLGVLYLGKEVDPGSDDVSDRLLLYDSKDLTTHAVCVGMTGSGKTGLCLGLLEEAAIDGVPALLIDPKGDLGNLLLTFPKLNASSFRPWIDESEATRKGQTPDEYAASRAKLWKSGLASWGQDGERIQRLKDAADFAVYTPGSRAGIPIRLLHSFTPPPSGTDPTTVQDRVEGAVTGLLTLLGMSVDPLTSREHILLSTLLSHAWNEGRTLDLATIIREIQNPPVQRVGVLDMDSFYPAKDRFALAMRINNLLASPQFEVWREGQPLDIDALLYTDEGKPRHSILSIAHLDERERMFFVTMLLNEVVAWTRRQAGTGSLRAIVYMDEVFGYLPPTAQPPSKKPLLTLLKQARAYGVSVVLATQNPVDLDYKALSNAGTWFLGRLQTERDQKRVLDGLETASKSGGPQLDRKALERQLASVKSRVFLLNNVHEDGPVLFHTRWAMSYLRGPLTLPQIETLMESRKADLGFDAPKTAASPPQSATETQARPAETAVAETQGHERPLLPPAIPNGILPANGFAGDGALVYRPALLCRAQLHWSHSASGTDDWKDTVRLAVLDSSPGANPWTDSVALEADPGALVDEAEGAASYDDLPPQATQPKRYSTWKKAAASFLYKDSALTVYRCAKLKKYSQAGESEGTFRGRLGQILQEKKDLALEKLRKRYATKFQTLQDRIQRAEQRVEKEESQHKQQKLQTAVAVGATILGALFGRKAASVGTVGRASSALKGAGRISREKGDIARAVETLETNREKLTALEEELAQEIDALELDFDPAELTLTEIAVRPKKTDLKVSNVELAWTPWRRQPDGSLAPEFE